MPPTTSTSVRGRERERDPRRVGSPTGVVVTVRHGVGSTVSSGGSAGGCCRRSRRRGVREHRSGEEDSERQQRSRPRDSARTQGWPPASRRGRTNDVVDPAPDESDRDDRASAAEVPVAGPQRSEARAVGGAQVDTCDHEDADEPDREPREADERRSPKLRSDRPHDQAASHAADPDRGGDEMRPVGSSRGRGVPRFPDGPRARAATERERQPERRPPSPGALEDPRRAAGWRRRPRSQRSSRGRPCRTASCWQTATGRRRSRSTTGSCSAFDARMNEPQRCRCRSTRERGHRR